MIIHLLSNDAANDKTDEDNANVNFDSASPQHNLKFSGTQSSPPDHATNLVDEGILAGQRIAKISVITLIGIGIVELMTGFLSGSVVATADGIDSISDAMISFIVLLGLRIATDLLTGNSILDIIKLKVLLL